MRINSEQLVMIALQGSVDHPKMGGSGYRVGFDGYGRITVGTGGITYNVAIGDACMGLQGDHIEPGVSLKHQKESENNALQALSCVGNTAIILDGDAKDDLGFVTGKHGGVDHVMIYFKRETLDKMRGDEHILIKGFGQGLKLLDHPDIHVMNLDPMLLDVMNIKEDHDSIEVEVTCRIPAFLMGSGLGSSTILLGDYDIMSQDKEANKKYGIEKLCFGDIVVIEDHYSRNGPHYQSHASTIGVIVHSDSFTSGHGPGVCVLFTCENDCLKTRINNQANLAAYLKIKG